MPNPTLIPTKTTAGSHRWDRGMGTTTFSVLLYERLSCQYGIAPVFSAPFGTALNPAFLQQAGQAPDRQRAILRHNLARSGVVAVLVRRRAFVVVGSGLLKEPAPPLNPTRGPFD
jgi:hypothetical protein